MKEEKLIFILLSTFFFQVSLVWSQSDINWNYDHRLDKNDQLALVKRITDQIDLVNIAKSNTYRDVRITAIEKITDQNVLLEIAINEPYIDVQCAAAQALNDQNQELLIEFLKNQLNSKVREIVVRKIDDQTVLSEIAKGDPDRNVRKAAVLGIMDESILIEIAKNDPDNGVRTASVRGITDVDVLTDIFKNEKNESVCKAAAYSIKDINKIIDLAKNHPVPWLRNQFRSMDLVTIRGTLINKNGKPLNNTTIYLLPMKNDGIGLSYEDGEISNIHCKTDINGQFSIIMKLYLFLDNNKFTLGYKKLNKIERLKSSDGSYFEMQFTDIQEVDLGQIFQDVRKTVTFIQYDEPPQPSGGLKQIQKNLVYPDIAKETGVEGRVLVYLQIGIDGSVLKTKIGKSIGSNACDEAAIEAVKSVKWLPAKNKGKPVTVWFSIPVDFKLK